MIQMKQKMILAAMIPGEKHPTYSNTTGQFMKLLPGFEAFFSLNT
jgi:hypothetical protein